MYTRIGVELFARGIRYTIGFAMTYTEELARGYTYTARACEGVYGIQRLTVYTYHPLLYVCGASQITAYTRICNTLCCNLEILNTHGSQPML